LDRRHKFIETFLAASARLDSPDGENHHRREMAIETAQPNCIQCEYVVCFLGKYLLPMFSAERSAIRKSLGLNWLIGRDQIIASGTKLANVVLGYAGRVKPKIRAVRPPGEQTKWILAGFHGGTSCRAVLH
jgi:hypothetical protein